jgi:DNA-binding response OmpR family regulator
MFPPETVAAPRRRPVCLLLAEDDDAMRGFVSQALTRDGYHVDEIGSGTDLALRLDELERTPVGEREIDVIISDIHMPGRSAIDVLADHRALAAEVPFVLITAFGSEETHAQARRLGATAVIDKPFDIDDLRTVLFNLAPNPRATE